MAELSRLYGVSRQTAHVWIKRYQAAGHDLRVMQDRSRRPCSNPRAVSLDMQDRLVAARKQHPRWGPLKLRAWLVERHPQLSFPSVSGIGAVLRRRGMTATRKPRRSASISATIASPFADCERPNDVWCMDFKGWFHTHDGSSATRSRSWMRSAECYCDVRPSQSPMATSSDIFSTRLFESMGCRNDCAPMADLPSFQRPHLRACLDSESGSCASASSSSVLHLQSRSKMVASSAFIAP